MKIVYKLTVVALLTMTSFANANSYLSFFQPSVSQLTMGEEGVASVGFSERNEVKVDASANLQLVMSLSHVQVKNNDLKLLSGDLLNYFEVIQDANELLFVQKSTIPADARLLVSMPVEPLQAGEYGGFIINMLADDAFGGDAEVSAYRLINEANSSVETMKKNTKIDSTWGKTQVYKVTLDKEENVQFSTKSKHVNTIVIKDETNGKVVKEVKKAKRNNVLKAKLKKGTYLVEISSKEKGSFTLQYK